MSDNDTLQPDRRLKKNELVRSSIGRLDKSITNKRGRKKKYTPTRMRNAINNYFEWCEREDQLPSISGMMIHLKMYRDQFYQYLEYPEFSDIMEQARLHIVNWCANDVYRTKGQAAGKIAYMANVHDWSQKISSENRNFNVERKIVSVEDATAKIASLAPALLEALKSSLLTNQLALPDNTHVVEGEIVHE